MANATRAAARGNFVLRISTSERKLLARAARVSKTTITAIIRSAALLAASAIVANGRQEPPSGS